MTHRFHPDARRELDEAFGYYAGIEIPLGKDFRQRIMAAIDEVCGFPFSYRLRDGGYRRINLARFPYYIPYIVEEEIVFVAAIAHNSRHPEYWKKRLS